MKTRIVNAYHQAKNQFQAQPTQKKSLLMLCVLATTLLLYFFLVWFPLYSVIEQLKADNSKQQRLLLWVKRTTSEIISLEKEGVKQKIIEQGPLLTLIDQESKGLFWKPYPLEMKQLDDKQVEITFNLIPFDELMNGLKELWEKDRIQVVRISVHRNKKNDLVKASLVLQG